jgi:hypothetical protein
MAGAPDVPMPPPTASDVVLQACQSCRNVRMTTAVVLRRNVGMVVFRRTYTIRGNLCKTCISKHFWEFEGKNILFGPWGDYFADCDAHLPHHEFIHVPRRDEQAAWLTRMSPARFGATRKACADQFGLAPEQKAPERRAVEDLTRPKWTGK